MIALVNRIRYFSNSSLSPSLVFPLPQIALSIPASTFPSFPQKQFHHLLHLIPYILCLIALIAIILIFNIRGLLKRLDVKEKILTTLMFFVLPLFPMFLLSGVALYIDYYTTNKQWKVEKVDFINRETYGGGKGGESYRYLVKIADSTFFLESDEYNRVKQELTLKVCKTNLGNIIFDRYYGSKPERNDARQATK